MIREASRYALFCVGAILAIALIFMLGGCATPPDHADVAKFISVDKAVAVSCIKADDVPTLPRAVGNELTGNAAHDASVLAAAVLEDRAWQGKAMAIIRGCEG